jgi:hypothetical protein
MKRPELLIRRLMANERVGPEVRREARLLMRVFHPEGYNEHLAGLLRARGTRVLEGHRDDRTPPDFRNAALTSTNRNLKHSWPRGKKGESNLWRVSE